MDVKNYLKEVLRFEKIKLFLSSLLFLYLFDVVRSSGTIIWFYSPPFGILRRILGVIDPTIFQTLENVMGIVKFFDLILSVVICYVIIAFVVYYYQRLILKYPKVNLFFGFFKTKIKIVSIILGAGLFFALLKYFLGYHIFRYLSFLALDDVTIIDYLFNNPGMFYHKIVSLIIAGVHWYVILSIIFYIRNKIKKDVK